MNNIDLLQSLEASHVWSAHAILQLREIIKNEDKFTEEAKQDLRNDILQQVRYNITEMEILTSKLSGELKTVEKATEEQKEVSVKLGKIKR